MSTRKAQGSPALGRQYKLEHEDGTTADPPSFQTSVPNWRQGDAIPLGQGRTLRVIERRDDSDGALLIVEEI